MQRIPISVKGNVECRVCPSLFLKISPKVNLSSLVSSHVPVRMGTAISGANDIALAELQALTFFSSYFLGQAKKVWPVKGGLRALLARNEA